MSGFFKKTQSVTRKSDASLISPEPNNRKVFMLVVDGLSEDFVAFDDKTIKLKNMSPEESFYKGKKLNIMKDLRESYPEGTMLFPMKSAAPTITSVRVKNLVNGGIGTFFEVTEEFMMSETVDDNFFF